MSFTLDKVLPWGRSFNEYVAMFALSDADLGKRILGCGDGPAAFNAALAKGGGHVVSADPLYRCSVQEVERRIEETFNKIIRQTKLNQHEFIWTHIKSVEELAGVRMKAMREFLADFPEGRKEGRYVDAELPSLLFSDLQFDLALCSHLLFLYSEQLSAAFHVASICELCRVAAEVRIFPLLELGSKPSRHLNPVRQALAAKGYLVDIVVVPYEFQRGGNQMLRVRKAMSEIPPPTGPVPH